MSFNEECLKAHNDYRAKHGAEPLILNEEICNESQKYAEYLCDTNSFEHSGNQNFGENLYKSFNSDPNAEVSGEAAVDSWYDEINMYDFETPGFSMETGHFTQVVWKDSKELGVGVATKDGCTWVVTNYYPRGNMETTFEENVLPPSF